mmetsp:Transcript_35787/g.92046  ORF Transcript_35787/g.92046 Transcript_35787/m.92046 type:complete len:306 (+) Transcript_35787:293-1210(+)
MADASRGRTLGDEPRLHRPRARRAGGMGLAGGAWSRLVADPGRALGRRTRGTPGLAHPVLPVPSGRSYHQGEDARGCGRSAALHGDPRRRRLQLGCRLLWTAGPRVARGEVPHHPNTGAAQHARGHGRLRRRPQPAGDRLRRRLGLRPQFRRPAGHRRRSGCFKAGADAVGAPRGAGGLRRGPLPRAGGRRLDVGLRPRSGGPAWHAPPGGRRPGAAAGANHGRPARRAAHCLRRGSLRPGGPRRPLLRLRGELQGSAWSRRSHKQMGAGAHADTARRAGRRRRLWRDAHPHRGRLWPGLWMWRQ